MPTNLHAKGCEVTSYELAREIDRLVRARIAANNGKSRDEVMRAHEQAEKHVVAIGEGLVTMAWQAGELTSLRDTLVRDAEDLTRASRDAEKYKVPARTPPQVSATTETTLPPDDIPF